MVDFSSQLSIAHCCHSPIFLTESEPTDECLFCLANNFMTVSFVGCIVFFVISQVSHHLTSAVKYKSVAINPLTL